MTESATLEALIPHRAPTEKVARTMLVAIRRLAVGGLTDAHATNILMGDFGMAYRRLQNIAERHCAITIQERLPAMHRLAGFPVNSLLPD